jgi:hypothetical protein
VQLERLREKLKLVFVSRERLSGRRFLSKWARHQQQPELWKVSENLVQVVPNVEHKSCYQYICVQNFAPVDWMMKTLSEEDWQKLEK